MTNEVSSRGPSDGSEDRQQRERKKRWTRDRHDGWATRGKQSRGRACVRPRHVHGTKADRTVHGPRPPHPSPHCREKRRRGTRGGGVLFGSHRVVSPTQEPNDAIVILSDLACAHARVRRNARSREQRGRACARAIGGIHACLLTPFHGNPIDIAKKRARHAIHGDHHLHDDPPIAGRCAAAARARTGRHADIAP